MIFVFGSNLSGFHGAGAAADAVAHHGAVMGCAEGMQGNSYAIPTKADDWRYTLPYETIKEFVDRFIAFARANPGWTFQVTRIGCGYAGLKANLIAPMFRDAPANCLFDTKWAKYLPEKNFWGTF